MAHEKPSKEDVEKAYKWAIAHAEGRTARMPDELREVAIDAATDAVMWALEKFEPDKATNGFVPFCKAAVKRMVWRRIEKHAKRYHGGPRKFSLDALVDPDGGPETPDWSDVIPDKRVGGCGDIPLPEAVAELPDELRDAVRLFYVDRFDMRECGLLLGVAQFTVRERLQRAARIVGEGLVFPPRKTGERRLVN